jgi:pimeloyl-ACP methyl ester carboxylesterase
MSQDGRTHDADVRVHARDSYLLTDGARLRYRDEGRGSVVIFIHGWTLDLDMWEPQAAMLSGAYRVVRLDRRGHGLSSGRPSLSQDLADLHALYRQLGLRQAALVGMSQGARTALHFSSSSPEAVSCLILDGTPRIGAAAAPDIPYDDYRALALGRGLDAFRREWTQHPLATLRTHDPRAHELMAQMIARYPGYDLTDASTAGLAAVPSVPTNTRMPVLLIGGEFDLDSRKIAAAELASQLPQAERVQIPGAGHLCNLDNPAAYTAAIEEFVARRAGPPHAH